MRITLCGKVITALLAAVGVGFAYPVLADTWLKAESEHFVVYSNINAKQTEAYASNLEKYRYVIGAFHRRSGVDDLPSPKLDVYLINGFDDLKKVMPKASSNVLGFVRICADGTAAYSINDGDRIAKASKIQNQTENESQTVLFHEYAHLFMMTYSAMAYPSWFIEGFAEYYSTTRIQDDKAVIGMAWSGRVITLMREPRLSWADILKDSPRIRQGNKVYSFYAQSWLLTHWIMFDPKRRDALGDYLLARNRGEDPVRAFEATFGVPVSTLGNVLEKYLDKMQAMIYGIKDMPSPKISLVTLPPSTDKLMLLDSGSRSCLPPDYEQVALEKIRAEAAKFPDDDYAKGALARAEIVFGDEEKALPYYQAYIAAHPADPEGFFRLGQTLFLMASHKKLLPGETYESQIKKARDALGKAYQLDPLNPVNLYYYSRTGKPGPDFPDDSTLNAAYEAHLLMPSVRDYALHAANLLIRKNRTSDARNVLVALANNPHGGALSEWVAEIIAAIDAGKPKDELLKIMSAPVKQDEPDKDEKAKPSSS